MARFPFVEGAAPLPPNPHAGGSDRLVWACRPLDYVGQDVVQGEVFPLQGLANDEALLRLDYCREVRPDDTVHVHNATGRRFIAAGWLQAFARTEPAPHEERMDG